MFISETIWSKIILDNRWWDVIELILDERIFKEIMLPEVEVTTWGN
jgi:hypothetical protein